MAEEQLKAMVIWQTREPFSAGADLKGALGLIQEGKLAEFEAMVANFQATSMAHQVRAGAGGRGRARHGLGGGCEFQMHSARTVAALESYIGLVEAGVGLLPAGGGLKEIATRCAAAPVGDAFDNVKRYFETVAMAKVPAQRAGGQAFGLLRERDVVVFNSYELLYVAKQQARALAESGYRPPLPARHVPVAGDVGTATFKASWSTCWRATSSRRTTSRSPAASPTPCAAARSSAAARSTRNGCWSWSASTSSPWRRWRRPRRASPTP